MKDSATRYVPGYCYQCVAGPDLLRVKLENDQPTAIEPCFDAESIHPGQGRVCVKAYGLIEKVKHPDRILQPMKRTNPKKGLDEDPRFVPISWDEALETVAAKLRDIRSKGALGDDGFPRIAVTLGAGGTAAAYMGTLPALLSAIGLVDFSFGSGQGVKCTHSEHLYGELWHRGFTVAPDTPSCRLIVSFGSNIEASGGVAAVRRHADARVERGLRRIQIEPQLSITGGASSEWIPIRPKTDAAFMFAMLHVLLHETPRHALDLPFLTDRTSSPYLVAPNGFFLRDAATGKPLVWDTKRSAAAPFDDPAAQPALEGTFGASGREVGLDGEAWSHENVKVSTAFSLLVEHLRQYTPEWAESICDVPAATVRRVTQDFLETACVGETTEVEGVTLPYRPVAVTLGRTVNNGWGGFEACWGRTMLAVLVGALEVPGGVLGTTVRLNRPATDRHRSVRPTTDGLMDYPFNPTERGAWEWPPTSRSGYKSLVPLLGPSSWSASLGPTHLAWLFQDQAPKHWPKPQPPDLWLVYRANPVISAANTELVGEVASTFPFTVCFAFTEDETNQLADILLPDATDLESTQLFRMGGNFFTIEQFWQHEGYALRRAAVPPRGEARDITDIATGLAEKSGLLQRYNEAINQGRAGVALSGEGYDFSLSVDVPHASNEIWDRACRAASALVSDGASSDGLEWYTEHGFRTKPSSSLRWYLYPTLVREKLRFELPYQERLSRVGGQLRRRMHEQGLDWWEEQLAEYAPLPSWKDFPGLWTRAIRTHGKDPEDFPFWLIGSHSMQYATGGNVAIRLMNETASLMRGHGGILMNATRARALGITEGEMIEVYSFQHATRGRAQLCEGIRPDTLCMIGQFGHTVTPFAKDLGTPALSRLIDNSLQLTDATGSTADLVRVGVRRVRGRA
ncbi:MAG: molybdopterin-dependent oxidoreductase [Deltaproteobacteria bacterium]|nr:molybdopterin-dependent oxidoreductase [Deltaproteobacteria bacterium]